MKVRILFYLVCVFFGPACCGVVPPNFKAPHDEHMHDVEILASSSKNSSIPILESSESRNTSSSSLVDHHQLNATEVLVSDFRKVSDLDHSQHNVPEEDLAGKKLPKGSSHSKKKGLKDSARFKNISQRKIGYAGMNDTQHHNSVDDHASEPRPLQTDHKRDLKINDSVDDHSLEPHHLQTDHKTEDLKIHGSVIDHSPEPQLDDKSDNLGFHSTVKDQFSKLDHTSKNFAHTDKNVSKSVHVENTTTHFDGEHEHSKDFATTFNDMLKIPDHELNNEEKDFINRTIDNENHIEDTKSDANNLNEELSNISDSDDLINSAKVLTHDWNNTSHETNNGSINNILSEFSIALEDVVFHDSTSLSQNHLNDPVAAQSNELKNSATINSTLDFTEDTNRVNKDLMNDSVAVLSNKDLKKSVNEVPKNVSEDLKSVPRNTLEFKNDSHDPPKTAESAQEHFNQADNTNDLLKSTVASITNSKLFLNIHNSFMRLNPTDKPKAANFKKGDETSENVISVSDDLTASKINEEISNKPSNMGDNSQEVNALDIKEGVTSPNNKVTDISNTETENRVGFSSGNTDEILVDPILNNKSESIDTVTEVVSAAESNASQGLFSSLGLGFLMNSELAKNAASAMEVFNFTDSALTDHIIDDQNDMHDLLDIRSSVLDDHNLSNPENSEQLNSIVDADSSTFNTDSSTLVTGSSKPDPESSTLVVESSSVIYISDEVSEINNNFKETFVKKIDSSELSGGNGSIEALTATTLNTTEELANVTMVPTILLNSTVEFEATTIAAQPDVRNASDVVGEVKCPPPGICIFWFFAQDTCTINSHCLGSRICCRIGCSKTCVEV